MYNIYLSWKYSALRSFFCCFWEGAVWRLNRGLLVCTLSLNQTLSYVKTFCINYGNINMLRAKQTIENFKTPNKVLRLKYSLQRMFICILSINYFKKWVFKIHGVYCFICQFIAYVYIYFINFLRKMLNITSTFKSTIFWEVRVIPSSLLNSLWR